MPVSPIEIFLRDCLKDLKRIAVATRGDASLDDVKSEAWLMAYDLASRGDPLDLASTEGKDSMLRKLYGKLVLRMRTCIGFARRLDKDWDQSSEDTGPRLSDRLRADELSDPLNSLEHREKLDALEAARWHSYSQATAYAICLTRWSSAVLATYLCITLGTLNCRLRHWRAWVERQPSLFDGIEQVAPDFTPLAGVPLAPDDDVRCDGEQRSWKF